MDTSNLAKETVALAHKIAGNMFADIIRITEKNIDGDELGLDQFLMIITGLLSTMIMALFRDTSCVFDIENIEEYFEVFYNKLSVVIKLNFYHIKSDIIRISKEFKEQQERQEHQDHQEEQNNA